ncbi:MAG: hypothetical protein ACJA2S_003030 [Cyclobacteriaceae bacterium]|jgi:hypothetical protein
MNILGFFKNRSELTVLLEKYNRLMKESHELSEIDRKESNRKFVEAQEVLVNIDRVENESTYR